MNLKYLIHTLSMASLILLSGIAQACGSDPEEEPDAQDQIIPQIVFLFSPGGLGDMSYNDCILEGVQQFRKTHRDIDVFISSPNSTDEAERIFSDWLRRPESNIPVLFVLASSDYETIADQYLTGHTLASNKSILLFESRRQYADKKVHTFQISMYGASYLAGALAAAISDGKPSLVMLANNSDGPTAVARDGFIAGHGGECDVEYLADDWTGYVAASLAYRKMSQWAPRYGFIFPVAGGSNAGIYRYSREFDKCPYLAGMDIDQSSLSTKITGSVIKHIDRLIGEYLDQWVVSGTMPASRLYGLESGYVDWLAAPRYTSESQNIINSIRAEAIEKENEYYEKGNN